MGGELLAIAVLTKVQFHCTVIGMTPAITAKVGNSPHIPFQGNMFRIFSCI